MYYVYIVRCADNSLYTGITTDIERRIVEHNSSAKGAKYTRFKAPVTLIYSQEFTDRSSASKREYEIKQLTKAQKELLL